MKTILLNDSEYNLVVSIMETVKNTNQVSGACDDWFIPLTEKNLLTAREMRAWNCNKTLEDFESDPNHEKPQIQGEEIFVPKYFAYGYAIHLLKSKVVEL